jgi:sporulation protein YlmC with PRC-barrel domain
MNSIKKLETAVAITAFSFALAAAPPEDKPSTKAETQLDRTPPATTHEFGKISKASDIVGEKVTNPQDEQLGTIKDLAVDLQSGRVLYAVLSSGGFLGLGTKLHAVPPSAFTVSGEKNLVLNVDKERLKSAPTFDRDNWPNMSDPTWANNIYSYYGQEPYWESAAGAASTRETAAQNIRDRATDLAKDRTAVRTATVEHIGKVNKASELLGMTVKNPQDESVGSLKDLAVDLKNGRIAYAILASGGVLGLGDKYFVVPPQAFQTPGDKTLVLNVDKDKLKESPSFETRNWPDFSDRMWGKKVYSYYGVEPYWELMPDTTRQNVRAPIGTESDRELAGRVRTALTSDASISTAGKNIRVMADNGTVTLRGAVDSQREKDDIEAKAKNIAGVNKVHNEIEVKK